MPVNWGRARGAAAGAQAGDRTLEERVAAPAPWSAVITGDGGAGATGPGDPAGPAGPGPDDAVDPAPVTPRAITASAATVLTSLLVAVAAVLPTPYAISSPGPTRDTLGEHDGTPLVQVEGTPTYPSTGELLLTTVSVAGGPGYPVSVGDVVSAWFSRERTVTPVELIYPRQESREDVDARNEAAMISSQENATVAALEELGYDVPTTLEIVEAIEGTGAAGVVQPGDVVVGVGGEEVTSFSELSARLDVVEPGATVEVAVEREGERQTLDVTTVDDGRGRALLGVSIDPEFDLPVDVEISIENVGGPSAGTMFALAIIDRLTEADETGGETVAGTGTMDLTGTVGRIGGIRQKLVGARESGATWFLAPRGNCDEVVGYEPDGLRVVPVETLGDARAALEAIGAGDGDGLPTC